MKAFLLNCFLAGVWVAATNVFTLGALLVGFIIGVVVLGGFGALLDQPNYGRKWIWGAAFLVYYLWLLVKSCLWVAFDVVTPRHRMRPGIISLPLKTENEFEVLLIGMLISLTPGTLMVDLSSDGKTLFIHDMYLDEGNIEKSRERIRNSIERPLLRILR